MNDCSANDVPEPSKWVTRFSHLVPGGRPVLDIAGEVIAVNTAIIPEYGGSNFGIPAEFVRQLLIEAGIEVE